MLHLWESKGEKHFLGITELRLFIFDEHIESFAHEKKFSCYLLLDYNKNDSRHVEKDREPIRIAVIHAYIGN